MRAVTLNFQTGDIRVEDVPTPHLNLVYSCNIIND